MVGIVFKPKENSVIQLVHIKEGLVFVANLDILVSTVQMLDISAVSQLQQEIHQLNL